MLQVAGFEFEMLLEPVKKLIAGWIINPSRLDCREIGLGKTGKRRNLIQR